MITRISQLIIAFLCLGLAAVIPAGLLGLFHKATPLNRPVVISRLHNPSLALVYVAEHLNYFSNEGLSVVFRNFETGKAALDDVFSGGASIGISYETPVVSHAMRGNLLSVLTSLHESSYGTGLIVRVQSGIHSVQDLVGKRIGTPFGTNAAFFLSTLLKVHGIDPRKVRIVDLQPSQLGPALTKAKIDAAAVWTPLLSQIEAMLPKGESMTFFSDAYRETSLMTTLPGFARANPEVISACLRALIRADEFARAHPSEALEILKRAFPEMEPSAIQQISQRSKFRLGLTNRLLNLLKLEAQWASSEGELPPLLAPAYLEQLKPEAVTVFAGVGT